jgi:hypothetical protein
MARASLARLGLTPDLGVVLAAGFGLTLVLAPSQPVPMPLELRWLAAYLLFVVMPGWLLVRLLFPGQPGALLERSVLALAAGYGLAALLGLVLHALFRPVAPWQLAVGGWLLVAVLTLCVACLPHQVPFPKRGPGVGQGWAEGAALALLLAVTAGLRLIDLNWSEFQGDEARVVLRAMAALQGADGALAAHRKVPGEILVTYLFAGSLGQIVEGVARLPFALAGVGAVLAFFVLARGLLGSAAALAAGLLLAVNGYFVAFGRILQYDSLAFFLGISGLICCWRFGQAAAEAEPPRLSLPGEEQDSPSRPAESAAPWAGTYGSPVAWAAFGALLIAGSALVALGAIFLVLPALVLAWPGLVRYFWTAGAIRHQPVRLPWLIPLRWPARSWIMLAAWSWPLVPALLAAILVLEANDPAAGPQGVWSYLGPRFGGERPYWNGLLLLQSANHYLSSPYLAVMLSGGAIAVLVGALTSVQGASLCGAAARLVLALGLAGLTWDRPRAALALAVLLAVALAFQAAGRLHLPKVSGGLTPSGCLDLALAMRVALVWAAGPLFVHTLLIRVPGTHWREAFPGLILVLVTLLAPLLVAGRSSLGRWGRLAQLGLYGLLGALIVGSGHYAWVTLVQRVPEYQLVYPEIRHPLDWTARDGRGIGGVFGTVHRHGWKALGVLSADGVLGGAFATNESPAIAAWYLRRPPGCEGAIDYIFRVGRAPHDRNLALPVPLPAGYVTRGRIREDGRATIAIQTAPTAAHRFGDFNAEAYVARFDAEFGSAWGPVGQLYRADLGIAQARQACAARPQPR